MRRTYRFFNGKKEVERQYFVIPVRYILALLITVLEVLAVIGIVAAVVVVCAGVVAAVVIVKKKKKV